MYTALEILHIPTPSQGYPEEWFPSVSATIGDRYPERSVFMLFIALTSGMELTCDSQNIAKSQCRAPVRIGGVVVHFDPPSQLVASEICRRRGHLPDIDLRWLDICDFYRRS